MNKKKWVLSIAVSILLAALLSSCAATTTNESTGEYIDDSAITANVKIELRKDLKLKLGQISVETYRGVVQLSGFINNEETSAKAEEIAGYVKGVKSVKNNLIVK